MQTEEAIREGASIILVDVDHLSDINGRFGRQAGDEVLAQVAVALRRILQGTELLFRNTSDEFVIFLSRADKNTATARAEGTCGAEVLRQGIRNPIEGSVVSVSVAVGSVPIDGSSMASALAVAEERLQDAHRGGPGPRSSGSIH